MKFESEEELERFRAAFESGTLPKSAWTHAAHIAIAGVFVWEKPDTALARARDGIRSLNQHHGTENSATSGYHETLTVFWISFVASYCSTRRASSRLSVINEMMVNLPANLWKQHYDFDVIASQQARTRWIPPDHL